MPRRPEMRSHRELRRTGKSKRYFSKMDRDVFVRIDFITF